MFRARPKTLKLGPFGRVQAAAVHANDASEDRRDMATVGYLAHARRALGGNAVPVGAHLGMPGGRWGMPVESAHVRARGEDVPDFACGIIAYNAAHESGARKPRLRALTPWRPSLRVRAPLPEGEGQSPMPDGVADARGSAVWMSCSTSRFGQTQHAQPGKPQPCVADAIAARVGRVVTAIDLDDQARLFRQKIGEVRPSRHLPAKLDPVQTSSCQSTRSASVAWRRSCRARRVDDRSSFRTPA